MALEHPSPPPGEAASGGGPSFGAALRREREMRGRSLDEVARETRIHRKFLQAIEDDRCNTLPGEAFVRGFIRSYAQCIGAAPEDWVNRYLEYRNLFTTMPVARPAPLPRTAEDPALARQRRLAAAAFALLCALGMAGVSWALWKSAPESASGAAAPRRPEEAEETMQTLAAGPESMLRIEAAADAPIFVERQGEVVLNRTLRRGEVKVYPLGAGILLRAAGAGTVRLTLDGREIPAPASMGWTLRLVSSAKAAP